MRWEILTSNNLLWLSELKKRVLKIKKPQKYIEWLEKYRVLPVGTTPFPGLWKTSRAPYLREILTEWAEGNSVFIAIKSCCQVGKGEVINNAIAYSIAEDPCPMLLVQPTVEGGEDYSKNKIKPMLLASPKLNSITKWEKQSIRKKVFPGGFLNIVGANSPVGLASHTIKKVFLDEVDRYPVSAGEEGDQISLAIKRTDTYTGRGKKIVITSTPGQDGSSKIQEWWEKSSMGVWSVPCPNCQEYTDIKIDNFTIETYEATCDICGCTANQEEWMGQQHQGKYIHSNINSKIKGYHFNCFSSPFLSWEDIAEEYKEALKDINKMVTFINTRLGLTYKEEIKVKTEQDMQENIIDFGAELHPNILMLTCGIDVQKNYFALEIKGWGLNGECYGVIYKEIKADHDCIESWKNLEDFLDKDFYKPSGEILKIYMTFIDTGGHYTQQTYNFLYGKEQQGIYGIKGDNRGRTEFIIKNSYVNGDNPVKLIILGVNGLKRLIYKRLEAKKGEYGCHYFAKGIYGDLYFKGLFSEVQEIVEKIIMWKKVYTRNEPLDVSVYATAAFYASKEYFEKLRSKQDGRT